MDIGITTNKAPQLDSSIDTMVNLIDLMPDAKTHFIKLDFINKGIDAVNLPSILRSKSVTETVPTYFKEKEPPIISYTYTKTIASKIFNFSSTLSNLDYHQFHNNPTQRRVNGHTMGK